MTAQFQAVDNFQGASGYANATRLATALLISGDPIEVNAVYNVSDGFNVEYEPSLDEQTFGSTQLEDATTGAAIIVNSENVIALLEADPDAVGDRTRVIMATGNPFFVRGDVEATKAAFDLVEPPVPQTSNGSWTPAYGGATGNATFDQAAGPERFVAQRFNDGSLELSAWFPLEVTLTDGNPVAATIDITDLPVNAGELPSASALAAVLWCPQSGVVLDGLSVLASIPADDTVRLTLAAAAGVAAQVANLTCQLLLSVPPAP